MTPDTLHLLASMVRHFRGAATATEKWANNQQPSSARREVIEVVGVARGILTLVESQLTQFDVTLEAEDERAEVVQPTRAVASRLNSPHHLTQVK